MKNRTRRIAHELASNAVIGACFVGVLPIGYVAAYVGTFISNPAIHVTAFEAQALGVSAIIGIISCITFMVGATCEVIFRA